MSGWLSETLSTIPVEGAEAPFDPVPDTYAGMGAYGFD